ncbi:uncharacterized protein LOC143469469 [Clavelina lepadiformis]|uniref:uncharacterized protein LOC143469469 n=1 Tax=Clavelina lepadiformis TaxID=159417 RepID=UPI004042C764
MNTPGDVRGHDSAFTGMYETDSNYRWRKVRGNLDLFVMERNERHLTSLQWKWQKMSKTRRRTPVYEGYYNSPSPNDDAYKNMPESARTRSRAESRQRMREELDSYFYDRWKTVDDRQQSANKSSAEGNVPVVSREALKHASVPHGDIKHHFDHFENDTQYPGSNHYPGVDTSKWSRHGYIPNQHYLPSMNSPYPNVYSNEIIPGQQPPYSIPRRKPGPNHHDNYPQSFGFTPRREFPDQGMGLSPLEQKSRGDTYNPFGTNNGKKSDEHGHYWTPRSRNQLFSPEDVGYPNYGYSPDYHNSGRNYQSPFSDHPDFQGQQYNYPSMNSSSMRTPYEYGRNNNDPWMKKNMAAYDPTLKQQEMAVNIYKADHSQNLTQHQVKMVSSPINAQSKENNQHDIQNRCRSRRRPRISEQCNTSSYGFINDLSQSRRRTRMFADVSTVDEEDDDVFVTSSPKANEECIANRWAEQPKNALWNGERSLEEKNEIRKEKFAKLDHSEEPRVLSEDKINSSKVDATNVHCNDGDSSTHFNQAVVSPPSCIRLPPLQAEHLASVRKSVSSTIPILSPGSSSLSAGKFKQSDRSRESGKRVAFTYCTSKDDDDENPFTPKSEREDGSKVNRTETPANLDHKSENTFYLPDQEKVLGLNTTSEANCNSNGEISDVLFFDVNPQTHSESIIQGDDSKQSEEKPVESIKNLLNENDNNSVCLQKESTIHVGNIDGKSDVFSLTTPSISPPIKQRNNSVVSLATNESSQALACHTTKENFSKLAMDSDNQISERAKEELNKTSNSLPTARNDITNHRPKETLWQIAKNIHRKMGTKLNLRREKSNLTTTSCVAQLTAGNLHVLPSGNASHNNDATDEKNELNITKTEEKVTTLHVHDQINRLNTSDLKKGLSDEVIKNTEDKFQSKSVSVEPDEKEVNKEEESSFTEDLFTPTSVDPIPESCSEEKLGCEINAIFEIETEVNKEEESPFTEDLFTPTSVEPIPKSCSEEKLGCENNAICEIETEVYKEEESPFTKDLLPSNSVDPIADCCSETKFEGEDNATFDSTNVTTSSTPKPIHDELKKTENSKGFYEEMRLEGNKKLNEETTVRLLNEQKEMEADLHKLQQILQEEMQKHKESEGVNEKLNAKIENLESQIAELNSRLSDNHAVLEENETERRNVKNGIEGPVNSGLHHNRPLFILSDPDHGATAALAQGRCPYHDEDNQDYNPLHSCEIMHYQSPFDTSQRFSHSTYSETPPSCVVHIDPLDITQKQQKELKADLEKQMAQLKEELKRQLEEQIPKTAENSESVIDVRVTLLEKQIEEMNKKIQRAESIIQKTEKEKRTKHEKESTNSPAEAKKDPDDKSDTNQNKIDETDLTKNLKLHKLSPKLPPSLSPKISPTAHLKISPGPNTPALQHNDDCGSRLKVSCYQSSSSSLSKALQLEAEHLDTRIDFGDQSDDDMIILVDDIADDPQDFACQKDVPVLTTTNSDTTSAVVDKFLNTETLAKDETFSKTPQQSVDAVDVPGENKDKSLCEPDTDKQKLNNTASSVLKENPIKKDTLPDSVLHVDMLCHKSTAIRDKKTSMEELSSKRTASSTTLKSSSCLEENDDLEITSKDEVLKNNQNLNPNIVSDSNKYFITFAEHSPIAVTDQKIIHDNASSSVDGEYTCIGNIDTKLDHEDKTEDFPDGLNLAATKIKSDNEKPKENTGVETSTLTKKKCDISKPTDETDSSREKKISQVTENDKAKSEDGTNSLQSECVVTSGFSLREGVEKITTPSSITPIKGTDDNGSPRCCNTKISDLTEKKVEGALEKSSDQKVLAGCELKDVAEHRISSTFTPQKSLKSKLFEKKTPDQIKKSDDANKTLARKSLKTEIPFKTACVESGSLTQRKSCMNPFQSNIQVFSSKSTSGVMFSTRTASKNKITLVATQKLESKPVTRAKISSNTAALPVDTNSSTAKKGKEISENACKNNWFSKRFFKAKPVSSGKENKQVKKPTTNAKDKKENDDCKISQGVTQRMDEYPGRGKKPKDHSIVNANTSKQRPSGKADLKQLGMDNHKKNREQHFAEDAQKHKSTRTLGFLYQFRKGKQKEDFKMETFSSSKTQKSSKMTIDSIKKDVDKNKKNPLKWSSTGDSKTKLTSVSAVSETSSLSGSKTTRFSEEPKQVKEVEREMTVTTMDSEMTQTNEEFSRIQSRTSNWASTSGGWANGRRSLLYGLGTNWCVCPKQIWKHLGDDTDDEPITRRKCISVIMGTILAILLFAIIVGLIIGLANMEGPTESPIRFVVIPSELDLEDESNAAEGN